MVTQKEVRETFDYHPEGHLIWIKVNPNAKRVYVGKRVGAYDASAQGLRVNWNGSHYLVHRLIYLWHHGKLPETIDHIDRDRLNNRIENLREATRSINRVNSSSTWARTGFRGVSKRGSRFIARLYKNKQLVLNDLFDTAEEASAAYEKARQELFPGVYQST